MSYHSRLFPIALAEYSRKNPRGSASSALPPICSNPHSNGRTRRLSSVVHRRCSYRRIRCSNQFIFIDYSGCLLADSLPPVSHRAPRYFCVIEPLPFLCHSRNVTIAAFFLFGLVIGSFLNVCITRIP